MNWVRLSGCALLVACSAAADRSGPGFGEITTVRHFTETPVALDLGRVIPRGEFTESYLVWTMTRFATFQKDKHRLSRLALSFRDSDLAIEYGIGVENFNPADYNGVWNRQHCLAEVLCINGSASGYVKVGERVAFVQILGEHDPRLIKAGHSTVRLVSFQLTVPERLTLDNFPYGSDKDLVEFAGYADPLPDISDAEQALAELRTSLGTKHVILTIRSDTAFGGGGGPPLDVFHPPFPDVPLTIYQSRPYLSCGETRRDVVLDPCIVSRPQEGLHGFPR